MPFAPSVHAKAIELTRRSIEMTTTAGSGHPTSAASLAHIVAVLMYGHMRYAPEHPERWPSDRLILSEGHACPIVYAAAADLGIAIGADPEERRPMSWNDALSLREIGSAIDGHPNPAEGFPFFPAATGSLGQGLSIAAGLALAARLDGSDARMFCLVGDGESREGQIGEALDFIVDQDLRAVCPIFNCNGYGQTGEVSLRQAPETLSRKLKAAGLEPLLINGHDPDAIRRALARHVRRANSASGQPIAILARTTKGWGFPVAQGKGHHGKPLTGDDREQALAELEAAAARVGARWSEGDLRIPPPPDPLPPRRGAGQAPPGNLTDALEESGKSDLIAGGKLATRVAYGHALRALGKADERVVALDGDVSNSTYAEIFRDEPELRGRFFECRIAEQNMVSCAAGLAAAGKRPFVSTFGKFLIRAYDQLEMSVIGRLPLRLVGSHVGVSPAADGPSQMALPDVAFFRALSMVRDGNGGPMMYILQPADAHAAYALTLAMAAHRGPCYLRTLRPETPLLYEPDDGFELGGHRLLARGGDLVIASAGYMLHEARKAAALAGRRGVRPTLVDLYSLPFDGDALMRLIDEHRGRILTVEDNYGAGIGSAVAELLAARGRPCTFRQMFVRRIPKSGRSPDDVLSHLSLAAADIARTAESLVAGETAVRA